MALTHTAVSVQSVSDSVQPNLDLVHRATALLVRVEPRRDAELVVIDLIERLRSERIEREARGLNHWEEHAPRFLSALVRRARRERQRRFQETETLYRTRHREIVRFALAVVGDLDSAEIVAAETYRELLEGAVPLAGFFAALVGNARNHIARRSHRRDRFVEIGQAFTPNIGTSENPDASADWLLHEPGSHRLEDQDPLDILIVREDEEERQRMLVVAKKDPRWRYIKRRDWAAPLREDVRN